MILSKTEKEVIYKELEHFISLNEIEDAIETFKPGKRHELDGMINASLIQFKDMFVSFIHTIFNTMFTTG